MIKYKRFWRTLMIKTVQIVARGKNGVIGNKGEIPWKLPSDLKYFKENTLGHVCIVGRKTYETIKHLKDRKFIVISRSGITRVEDGIIYERDIDTALSIARINTQLAGKDQFFIIGGAEIYNLVAASTNKLLVTEVDIESKGDAFYHIPEGFELTKNGDTLEENGITYRFTEYEKVTKYIIKRSV